MEHANVQPGGLLERVLDRIKSRFPEISSTTETDIPRIIENMPFDVYIRDTKRMNSSGIKELIRGTMHYVGYLDKRAEKDDEDKPQFRFGRAAHMVALEPDRFKELYVVMPEFAGFTKDGKATSNPNALDVKRQREAWLEKQKPGALILTEEEFEGVLGVAEFIAKHKVAGPMIFQGRHESTIQWTDRDTGVMCKARPDCIAIDKDENIHLVDLKTTKDARISLFANDAGHHQYHVQMAFYHDAIVEALGKQPLTITLIAVESAFPHTVKVYPMEDDWYNEGRAAYKKALAKYKKYRETGVCEDDLEEAEMLHMPLKFKQHETLY